MVQNFMPDRPCSAGTGAATKLFTGTIQLHWCIHTFHVHCKAPWPSGMSDTADVVWFITLPGCKTPVLEGNGRVRDGTLHRSVRRYLFFSTYVVFPVEPGPTGFVVLAQVGGERSGNTEHFEIPVTLHRYTLPAPSDTSRKSWPLYYTVWDGNAGKYSQILFVRVLGGGEW